MNKLDITNTVSFSSITQEMFPRCMSRVFTCEVDGALLKTMLDSANRFNVYTHSGVDMVVTYTDSRGNITLVELVKPW